MNLPTIIAENEEIDKDMFPESIIIPMTESNNASLSNIDININGITTMTPQQIAQWIDKRSRIFFPIGFIVFNIFYWTFVYIF